MIGLIAKAIAGLLGGVSVWGATAAPDGIDGAEWFGLLAVLGTAVAVFAVPNTPAREGPDDA